MKLGRGKNTIPHTQRKSGKKAIAKARRRQEAETRQAYYDSLDSDQKEAHKFKMRVRYQTQLM